MLKHMAALVRRLSIGREWNVEHGMVLPLPHGGERPSPISNRCGGSS